MGFCCVRIGNLPSEDKKDPANRFQTAHTLKQLRRKLLRTITYSGGHIEFQEKVKIKSFQMHSENKKMQHIDF